MTDSRRILSFLALQLYRDVRFVTQLNPVNIVDEETSASFNALLVEAKRLFPGNPILDTFREMSPRNVKYKDAVIVAGQLAAFLDLTTGGIPTRGAAAAAAGTGNVSAQHTPVPDTDLLDHAEIDAQLYGASSSKRNPDGTIPFSLE